MIRSTLSRFFRPARLLTPVSLLLLITLPQAIAQVVLSDIIETQSLTKDAFATGTLSRQEGALDITLWQGSTPETLSFLLDQTPSRPSLPAIGEALRRTLLSSGQSSTSNSSQISRQSLGGKKLLALVNAGFIEEAQTIASLSDAPRNDPFTGKALALADLLEKKEVDACTRGAGLTTDRGDPFWVKLRAFCYSLSGERDAADLTLSLLRDQGLLEIRDEEFLTAMVTGFRPAKPLFPKTVLELAVTRQLGATIAPGVLKDAEGSVVRALVDDSDLSLDIRILAARRAMAMGLMTGREFGALLSSISIDIALLDDPIGVLRRNPTNPQTDVIVWQVVQAMNAPEFLRDKAALIAAALGAGVGFDHKFSLNNLYAGEVANLEGALIPAQDAARYALSRMSVGDGEGAGRWLLGMKGDDDITSLGDELTLEFMNLTNLLQNLDLATAAIVAESAGIALTGGHKTDHSAAIKMPGEDAALPARVTETVFDAAMGDGNGRKKLGQAALASLALSDQEKAGIHPVQSVVMERAFIIAGLDDIRRKFAFQNAWKATTPKASSSVPRNVRANPDTGLLPSLKPNRRN